MSLPTIRYDLSTTLQPYPVTADENDQSISDLNELGAVLVRRNLSPHATVSAGVAGELRLPAASSIFTPANGVHAAHEAIIRWRGNDGIIRLIPDDDALSPYDDVAEDVGLLNGFRLPVEELLQHDRRKTLVLSSPNGISGRIATLQEIVRLARHFRLVVIDERLAGFSMRRLTPLVLEWENIVFVERFPFLMPGQTTDFGWMVHPSVLREEIAGHVDQIPEVALNEALRYGAIHTFREERRIARRKSQLYRELRKLSILSVPYPSWSNSLLARVERGDRDEIVWQLAERGITVYSPPHPNLQQHIRITAISNEATMALREALVEINRGI